MSLHNRSYCSNDSQTSQLEGNDNSVDYDCAGDWLADFALWLFSAGVIWILWSESYSQNYGFALKRGRKDPWRIPSPEVRLMHPSTIFRSPFPFLPVSNFIVWWPLRFYGLFLHNFMFPSLRKIPLEANLYALPLRMNELINSRLEESFPLSFVSYIRFKHLLNQNLIKYSDNSTLLWLKKSEIQVMWKFRRESLGNFHNNCDGEEKFKRLVGFSIINMTNYTYKLLKVFLFSSVLISVLIAPEFILLFQFFLGCACTIIPGIFWRHNDVIT